MSKVYFFTKGRYREIDNLNALIRHKGSLLVIEDAEALKHINMLTDNNNNYIFIILNGSEEALIEKLQACNLYIKPKKVFVISKETEEQYFNDLPKLLPCVDSWDTRVAELFIRIKDETREFFNKCACNYGLT